MMFGNNRCAEVPAPMHLSYLTMSLSSILAPLTIAGNALVLIVVAKYPTRELRTTFVFLLVNLAVADLIVGSITEPISIVTHAREALKLDISTIIVAIHFSYFLSCMVSVLSLAGLTIDRYLAISHPLWYRATATPNKVIVLSLGIWLFSGSLVSAYFAIGYIPFAFVFANTAIVFTLVVFLFTYWGSLRKLNVSIKALTAGQTDSSAETTANKVAMKREKKFTQAFLSMLLFLLLCYVPAGILIYFMNFCNICSCIAIHWFRDLQFVFVLVSSAVNPFVYALRLPSMRRRVVGMFSFRSGRVGPSDGSDSTSNKRASYTVRRSQTNGISAVNPI